MSLISFCSPKYRDSRSKIVGQSFLLFYVHLTTEVTGHIFLQTPNPPRVQADSASINCHRCSGQGQWLAQCPTLAAKGIPIATSSHEKAVVCFACGKTSHLIMACLHDTLRHEQASRRCVVLLDWNSSPTWNPSPSWQLAMLPPPLPTWRRKKLPWLLTQMSLTL